MINDRTKVADPRDPNGVMKRAFVYDSDPFQKSIDFGDFPYIYVELPSGVEYSNVSVDGKVKNIGWKFNIVVRSSRDGASNTSEGLGKSDILSIGDSLQFLFNNDAYKQEFAALRMFKMTLTKQDADDGVIDQKPVFVSSYELVCMERITVSD